MHQALPFKTWHSVPTNFPRSPSLNNPTSLSNSNSNSNSTVIKRREDMKSVVDENAVIVFGRRGCCMTHVVRRLLLGLGVNPAVYEVDERDEDYVVAELQKMGPTSNADEAREGGGFGMSFPTVFIGGKWFGGLERVMATHITGELTPILRQAGALWL